MDDKNGEMTDRDTANEGVRALLRLLGQDPSREGLEDTPRRVLQAYLDLRRDWREPSEPLGHVFKADAAGSKLTSVNGIPCSSYANITSCRLREWRTLRTCPQRCSGGPVKDSTPGTTHSRPTPDAGAHDAEHL